MRHIPLPAASSLQLLNEILIVDDHTLVRVAVRLFLEENGFDVCGEASGGLEAIEKVRKLAPGIIVLDVNMPGMNGIQAAIEIRRIAPAAKIVFFTVHGCQPVAEAMRPYGHAFVSKTAASTELIPTLRRLMTGGQKAASA